MYRVDADSEVRLSTMSQSAIIKFLFERTRAGPSACWTRDIVAPPHASRVLPSWPSAETKSLCLYREDLDSQLRDRSRFGDPMAHLVKKKQAEPPAPVIPEHVRQQMTNSGFVIPHVSLTSILLRSF